MKRIVLVGGGVRSGKSDFALRRAARLGEKRVFIATAQAWDGEMTERIGAHQRERDPSFVTVEEPLALERAIDDAHAADVVLVDCLTLWVSNLLCQDVTDAALGERFDALVRAIEETPASVVLVTNEVGLGIVPDNALARRFRDAVGACHRRLAERADEVHFAAMGMVMRWKPTPVVPSRDDGSDGPA
jgi:adenosylcobinamide kinase/adenosylcobinamide-phosphate guanylyltransferase